VNSVVDLLIVIDLLLLKMPTSYVEARREERERLGALGLCGFWAPSPKPGEINGGVNDDNFEEDEKGVEKDDRRKKRKRKHRKDRKEKKKDKKHKHRKMKKDRRKDVDQREKSNKKKLKRHRNSSSSSSSTSSSDDELERKKGKHKKMKCDSRDKIDLSSLDGRLDDEAKEFVKQLNEKKKRQREEEGRGSQEEDIGETVGPLPKTAVQLNQRDYGKALLPGEGAAMAAFIAEGKRIPRRGEIGLTSDEIEQFEQVGYVMSGSRHHRMEAVRIRKENQLYSADEKRALQMFNKEERAKRESKILSQFREMVKSKREGGGGGSGAGPSSSKS